MMNVLSMWVGILIAEVFVVMLLYLLFGQIRVRKFKNTSLSTLYADTDLLVQYTNTFVRALANLFRWLFVISGVSMWVLGVIHENRKQHDIRIRPRLLQGS